MTQSDICAKIKKATVAICLKMTNGDVLPFGSGVNLSPDGIVVTCSHVIKEAQAQVNDQGKKPDLPEAKTEPEFHQIPFFDIVVCFTLAEPERLGIAIASVQFWYGLHDRDLAICRLNTDQTLPFLDLGDSEAVQEGDRVLACGFPLGSDLQPGLPVGSLFHHGIVAGIRPHSTVTPRTEFLLDMSVKRGNSGGPLCISDTGQVIGIVNAKIIDELGLPTGIGCAVPSNMMRPLVDVIKHLTEEELKGMKSGIWPDSLKGL